MTEHIVYWIDANGLTHAEHCGTSHAADKRVTYLQRSLRVVTWHALALVSVAS